MPLVALDQVTLAYGHLPLVEHLSFQIEPGERVALIGRNGSGKSTLLKLISGELQPDAGTIWRQPGVRIARLEQDVPLSSPRTVFDVVVEGHRAESADDEAWRAEHQVDQVLSRLGLEPRAVVDALSGGWRRRVLMARALVGEPDLLLLDEPTNHLDVDAIVWLENFLAAFRGSVLFVTHDRAFLQRLATRIVELDRARLTSWPGDYATYLRRREELLAADASQAEKFDKKLAEEEAWLRQGIKARRTRNEGRVRALVAMRAERAQRREATGAVRLKIEQADISAKMVFEADNVSKSFAAPDAATRVRPISAFSTRIVRGDRIGVLGPNGAGKTTLLRLLIGEITPDSGEVRRGANVRIAYYDQQREQLDPERTVFETVGDGSDTITVNGVSRHVMSYLRDFLFPAERARSPVRALSGGERNRLLLARLFTRPANVLVLDEPTNDLDVETLELLEAELAAWDGTLLLVSHDRAFLDNVVTSTLVVEADGHVAEYVGGYEDYLRQRSPARRATAAPRTDTRPASEGKAATAGRKKLSYNEQREVEQLPGAIDALEREQRELNARIASPDFYKAPRESIEAAIERIESIERELATAYERWYLLDSQR